MKDLEKELLLYDFLDWYINKSGYNHMAMPIEYVCDEYARLHIYKEKQ